MGNRSVNSHYNALMTSHRRHLLIALLLPLLALRAMLPVGVMPAVGDGEVRLVMCSDGLLLPAEDAGGKGPIEPIGGDCPFAQALFEAPPPHFIPMAALSVDAPALHRSASSPRPPATGPPRPHGARGPPSHS